MKTNFHFSSSVWRKAAFTKIELLVIVMVVATLGSLVTSASRCAQNQVKIAECADNLRQFARTQLLYAEDYSDQLPVQQISFSYLPWDLAWDLGPVMNQYGTPQQVMYCPGTAPRFQAAENALLYQYAPGALHVLGYALTFPGNSSLIASNVNSMTTPQPINVGPAIVRPPPAATRVLIADANITQGGNYVSIVGGFGGALDTHVSPHLNGILPAGGNVAMLDGHVEWRPFGQMKIRTAATAGTPDFLW